jgi:hypothetical protein
MAGSGGQVYLLWGASVDFYGVLYGKTIEVGLNCGCERWWRWAEGLLGRADEVDVDERRKTGRVA